MTPPSPPCIASFPQSPGYPPGHAAVPRGSAVAARSQHQATGWGAQPGLEALDLSSRLPFPSQGSAHSLNPPGSAGRAPVQPEPRALQQRRAQQKCKNVEHLAAGHRDVELYRFRKQLPTFTEKNPLKALNARTSMLRREIPELELPRRQQYLREASGSQTLGLTQYFQFQGQAGVTHSWIFCSLARENRLRMW